MSRERLAALLRKAEQRFRALGDEPLFSMEHESGQNIGDLIAMACWQLQSGEMSSKVHEKLWRIFAPTTVWDDEIGDVDLGNEVFALLESARRSNL